MDNKGILTRVLAMIGTVLVWFPIAATILISFAGSIGGGETHVDYLMPAELFPIALFGGMLLLWAALRAGLRRRLIGWTFGGMIGLLVISQGVAVVSGLSSGKTAAGGWQSTLVLSLIALYIVMLIVLGVAGVLLVRDLFPLHSKESGVY